MCISESFLQSSFEIWYCPFCIINGDTEAQYMFFKRVLKHFVFLLNSLFNSDSLQVTWLLWLITWLKGSFWMSRSQHYKIMFFGGWKRKSLCYWLMIFLFSLFFFFFFKAAAQNDFSASASPPSVSSTWSERQWRSRAFPGPGHPNSSAATADDDASSGQPFPGPENTTQHTRTTLVELAATAITCTSQPTPAASTASPQEHSHQPSLQRTLLLTCARYAETTNLIFIYFGEWRLSEYLL